MSNRNLSIQPVTAIYDLGRGTVDGRGIEHYMGWLQKTIKLFPDVVVYCDEIPKIDNADRFSNWVIKKKETFNLWQSMERITRICEDFRKSSEDVTFQLPSYGVLQFSKFEILKEVSLVSTSENLLWIDAGISRFISQETYSPEKQIAALSKTPEFKEALFEIDLRRNVLFGQLRKAKIGSCRRTFSGTSFLLKKASANQYFQALNKKAESWIENDIWDNEQVGLNACFHDGGISPEFVQQDELTGSVARRILQGNLHEKKILNRKKLSRKMFA